MTRKALIACAVTAAALAAAAPASAHRLSFGEAREALHPLVERVGRGLDPGSVNLIEIDDCKRKSRHVVDCTIRVSATEQDATCVRRARAYYPHARSQRTRAKLLGFEACVY